MRLKLGRICSRYLADGDATYRRRFKWIWRKETCNFKDFYGGHNFEERREEEEAILNYDLFLANIFFTKRVVCDHLEECIGFPFTCFFSF